MGATGNTTRILAPRFLVRAALVVAAGCLACAKGPALVNPGASRAPAPNAPLMRETPDAGAAWEMFGEVAGYRKLSKAPFPSQGHFDGRWIAEVRANDFAAPEYVKLPSPATFPKGSVVVQTHTERTGGTAGPVFAMVKRDPGYFPAGGDWEYVVTFADGRLQDRGPLPLCARCHADAPSGWLFGLTQSAR